MMEAQWGRALQTHYNNKLKKAVFHELHRRAQYRKYLMRLDNHVTGRNAKTYAETKEKPVASGDQPTHLEHVYKRTMFRAIMREAYNSSNRRFQRKIEEEIQTEVMAKVEEKKAQLEFLESMVIELSEKLKVETRKKQILKNQCDQAYLRGVSSLSNEALKMSYSTLDDLYRGMKMPEYDGQNIYHQMRSLNAHTTLTEQIHDQYRFSKQQNKDLEQKVVTEAKTSVSKKTVRMSSGGRTK